MTIRLIAVLSALLFSIVSSVAAAEFDHSTLDSLLKEHVSTSDGGRSTKVDYLAMKQSQSALTEYLSRTAEVSKTAFNSWPKSDQLAFLINVYNARTIQLVLEGYPGIASIKDLGSVFSSPWGKDFVPLFGSKRSLDDIEHELIRGSGRYNDPRIHFAVNCASIGCPALRAEAYSGDRLDAQLEDQTRKFLSDRSRNRFRNGNLEVSSIFKWYGEDFKAGYRGSRSPEAFLSLYSEMLGLSESDQRRLKDGGMQIRYLNYDWRLNSLR